MWEIRRLEIEALTRLKEDLRRVALAFYSASEHLRTFDIDCFIQTWTSLIQAGAGVIFGYFDGGEFSGAIGGAKHRDPNSQEMLAAEFFWFIMPEKRGGGLNLLDAFESWARGQGCNAILMVHMLDLMPEVVERIYSRRGYRPIEVTYRKEV